MNNKILRPLTQEQVIEQQNQMNLRILRLQTATTLMASMIDGLENGDEFVSKAEKATKAADALLSQHGFKFARAQVV